MRIKNLDELEQFAHVLASRLKGQDLILLNGDLGAGKTTLTQLIGKALGVKRVINSPTFNIIKSYQGDKLQLHHMDCYRLEESEEDLGFDEYFLDEEAVTIIEWSQFIETFLPNAFLEINIKVIDETTRDITIHAKGRHYQDMKEGIEREVSFN
ncbi:tRNA (adenosine(37)-N6)-threonylcarbamoyltransferase complex ATPase subunit type 1 TsaE [Staphylococcus massiliensis]|nr:tRNA (adenosine(37)-N6)-threonylcarbamoyltransferase complex ATPase subunit type 1 TsaE [Staphylococcus massiliensis]MCG3399871.1 tRNA (adenosine(37)-N6)-threonylcarbamoyltransferase complex ATPase subunit type 1 TsaE [Staphylococcus massiliensis]MCG3402871.1 tRNA (adenosine(37)-N6)-threonylcarbamoyltransferase complex ATPase subunit type 1 TsaE [Staphylococcus massiliensis]MCG3413058.1 tRNA (adenosine(37)-N6)-threonylcarbamoyltransferase complex ATPase subunit type 1 TsaE [Staphylococcus mas